MRKTNLGNNAMPERYILLIITLFVALLLSAQQSCYEQYMRENNMPLPADNVIENDNSYDELKNEVILAIDTITGTCHLLAEDGTILADAQLALVDSTWYMWLSVDPLADKNIANTPYMYCGGNPIMLVDPDGRDAEVTENADGTYKVTNGNVNDDLNIYVVKDGRRTGEIIGQMLTPWSFFDNEEKIVSDLTINLSDMSGQEFYDHVTIDNPTPTFYAIGALPNLPNDFKNVGGEDISNKTLHHYRAMPLILYDGTGVKIATARDVGNVGAGYVAGVAGVSWEKTRFMFDLLQGKLLKRVTEPAVSQSAQYIGYVIGFERIGKYLK